MKISYKLKTAMDTTALLKLSGIAQGELLLSLKRSASKKRLLAFKLEYDGVTISFPPRDGEQTIEL